MLHRRDPIFWAATAIFVLSLALAKFVDDGFLLLMVASYLLRPALHSLGFAKKLVDERQMQIQYQASNVAFTALVIGNIVVILYLMGQDDHNWEMVNAVLMVGLAVRAIAGLLLVGDPAVAGPRIVMAVGAFLCLFGVVEGGLPGGIVHGLPGLAVIGLGLAARKAPRIIGGVVLAAAVAVMLLITAKAYRSNQGLNWGTAVTVVLLGAPLVVAAVCILRGASIGDPDSTAPAMSSAGPGAAT